MTPRNLLRILGLAAAGALAIAASSWHWTTAAERAAAPIVAKNVAARGGLEAWRAIKSMSIAGSLDAGVPRDPVRLARAYQRTRADLKAEALRAVRGQAAPEKQVQLPFLMELKRPRKSRVEIQFHGDTAVQVFDGDRGWKLRPFLGRRDVEPFTAEERQLALQQSDLDGPLIDAAEKHERIALLATERVDGRDAYKLEVRSRGGAVRHVWVDAQTFLDVKVDGTRRVDGKPRAVWTRYRDFRPVDGLVIPHVLETTVDGIRGSEKIVVERVALNPPLGDGRFTRPD